MFIALAAAVSVEWLASVTLLGATSAPVHLYLVIAAASLALHVRRARRLARQH
jgi:hypothetical protein